MTRQCGVPWPVCPICLGTGMLVTGRLATCSRCGDTVPWHENYRCKEPVSTLLTDSSGAIAPVCASHAAHASVAKWPKRKVGAA